MTEISNMVSYYNHSLMYGGGGNNRQQQSMSPVSPASSTTTQVNMSNNVSQTVTPLQDANAQQQCSQWYYQHHHHHHHQQQQHQQYLEATEAMPAAALWSAHAHPYLQYQHHHHHAAAYQQQQMQQVAAAVNAQSQQSIDWNSDEANNNNANNNGVSEPSPAITVSGSEISSPGTPASPTGNNNNLNVANNNTNAAQMRSNGNRSPYEWMKKNSYQPNPGKTRTKEKYRVVYTEHQRLELEKEFYSSKYITIRRKTELATSLALSERQVKIWFQNRRAKERKQTKKRSELEQRDIKPILDAHGVAHVPPTSAPTPVSGMANLSLCNNMNMGGMTNLMMSNLMPPAPSPSALMAHHHHHHHHQSLLGAAVAAAAAAQQQQQQQHHPQHPAVLGVRTDTGHAL